MTLEISGRQVPFHAAAVRSTPEFDLFLDLPAEQLQVLHQRQQKERDQLKKNISNHERQLTDEKFVAKAPAHVIEGMRQKLAAYRIQLDKLS